MSAFRSWLLVLLVFLIGNLSMPAYAENIAAAGIPYVLISNDENGVAHFHDRYFEAKAVPGIAVAGSLVVPDRKGQGIGFVRFPPNYSSDYHRAPRRQYIMVLEGSSRVTLGDGEARVFRAGSILLLEDISGQGHKSDDADGVGALLAWVPAPE